MKFEFNVGDKVHVESLHGDLFDSDFTGIITDIEGDTFVVKDQDGELWSVEKSQVTFAKHD